MTFLSANILDTLHHPAYWNHDISSWSLSDWDMYYIDRTPECTKEDAHRSLGCELKILRQHLPAKSVGQSKVIALQKALQNCEKDPANSTLWKEYYLRLTKFAITDRVNEREIRSIVAKEKAQVMKETVLERWETSNAKRRRLQTEDMSSTSTQNRSLDSEDLENSQYTEKEEEGWKEMEEPSGTPPLMDELLEATQSSVHRTAKAVTTNSGTKRSCDDDTLHIHEEVELETSKTSVQVDDTISLKWEFDSPMPPWLTKATELRSNTAQSEAATKALCWRIVDVSDPAIVSEFSSSEFEELNTVFASALKSGNPKEDLMLVETLAESYLQMLSELDPDQLKSIGNLVKIEGIRGALREALKLVGTKKKDQILFEDEVSISPSLADMTEEDCTHDDVGYIFELLRYTCEWISASIVSRHNSERDIDMFVKSHIFSCLKGVTDLHFGEMVSRSSRDRRASALDSPDNAEGYHVDWMFTRHDLSDKSWGQEFSMCERAGSKVDNKAKVDSDTLKIQKTLRDMHKALLKDISAAGGGAVTKSVLNAFTKLIMPGFVSSFFFIRVILVVYIGAGFYASRQMAEFNIPTNYDQLGGFIDVARAMLRAKNIMRNTVSWFKAMKARAEREQFVSGRIKVNIGPPEFGTPSKKRIARKRSVSTDQENPFL